MRNRDRRRWSKSNAASIAASIIIVLALAVLVEAAKADRPVYEFGAVEGLVLGTGVIPSPSPSRRETGISGVSVSK